MRILQGFLIFCGVISCIHHTLINVSHVAYLVSKFIKYVTGIVVCMVQSWLDEYACRNVPGAASALMNKQITFNRLHNY